MLWCVWGGVSEVRIVVDEGIISVCLYFSGGGGGSFFLFCFIWVYFPKVWYCDDKCAIPVLFLFLVVFVAVPPSCALVREREFHLLA